MHSPLPKQENDRRHVKCIGKGAKRGEHGDLQGRRCIDNASFRRPLCVPCRLPPGPLLRADSTAPHRPSDEPHPSDFPFSEPESRYGLYSRAGWPSDTTVTMCRLVYAGYLERWPDLKIIVHHSGGTVPMLAGRLKVLQTTPGNERIAERLKHPPLEYLRRFYADTANFGNPIALRAALDFFGPEHILFGTDFGFNPTFAPETIEDVESVILDDDVRRAVYERNARRVLRLDEAPFEA